MQYTTYKDKHGPYGCGAPDNCPACPCVKIALSAVTLQQ